MVLQNKSLWIGVLIVGLCLREVRPCWYDSTSDYASVWYANKEACGTLEDNGKIVGGDAGYVKSWPWLGFLETNGGFTCTVELIAWNWATTAAHCVDNGVTTAQLKVTFGRSNKQWTHGQVRNVNKIIIHPGYNTYAHNDIALLRLDAPATYGTYVRPVCLPDSAYDDIYDNCYIAGWGRVGEDGEIPQRTDELRESKMTIKTNTECHNQDGYDRVGYPIRDEHICADKEDANGNPIFGGVCNGDSGGPLMCQLEAYSQKAWVLVGITSFYFGGCGNAKYFDVFTRASKFNQWITDCVDKNGGPFIA